MPAIADVQGISAGKGTDVFTVMVYNCYWGTYYLCIGFSLNTSIINIQGARKRNFESYWGQGS